MKNVHDTHIKAKLRVLHAALLDIFTTMNRPERDDELMRAAGIRLDRALFPLLVGIERFGPIGIVDLAGRAGRDYTTVSRQVAKLAALGLVERRDGEKDRRVKEAVITAKGKTFTGMIDGARDRIGAALFSDWEEQDIDDLVRLMRRFADAVKDRPVER